MSRKNLLQNEKKNIEKLSCESKNVKFILFWNLQDNSSLNQKKFKSFKHLKKSLSDRYKNKSELE